MKKWFDWYVTFIGKYKKHILFVCIVVIFWYFVIDVWYHDTVYMTLNFLVMIYDIVAIHQKQKPPRDDDHLEEDLPETPNGDFVDRWLKEKTRV